MFHHYVVVVISCSFIDYLDCTHDEPFAIFFAMKNGKKKRTFFAMAA